MSSRNGARNRNQNQNRNQNRNQNQRTNDDDGGNPVTPAQQWVSLGALAAQIGCTLAYVAAFGGKPRRPSSAAAPLGVGWATWAAALAAVGLTAAECALGGPQGPRGWLLPVADAAVLATVPACAAAAQLLC